MEKPKKIREKKLTLEDIPILMILWQLLQRYEWRAIVIYIRNIANVTNEEWKSRDMLKSEKF